MADDRGEIVNGDQILGLCAQQMVKENTLDHMTVVTTPVSNSGLNRALEQLNIKTVEAAVGDRNVVEADEKSKVTIRMVD